MGGRVPSDSGRRPYGLAVTIARAVRGQVGVRRLAGAGTARCGLRWRTSRRGRGTRPARRSRPNLPTTPTSSKCCCRPARGSEVSLGSNSSSPRRVLILTSAECCQAFQLGWYLCKSTLRLQRVRSTNRLTEANAFRGEGESEACVDRLGRRVPYTA